MLVVHPGSLVCPFVVLAAPRTRALLPASVPLFFVVAVRMCGINFASSVPDEAFVKGDVPLYLFEPAVHERRLSAVTSLQIL